MSTAPEQSAEPTAQVTVTLDRCGKEDAKAVLDALHTSFPCDSASESAPGETAGDGPVVRTATFDVSRTLALPGPGRLSAPVTLTAQGGYHAVDRLREGLAESFAVTVTGTASGDQEQEVAFRLDNR
ncbi:hypothetical protein [Actinacidiphila epipremni]|uniref:Uncharacterized protein n=1 Tax=Actinacidiphila epipremni TaxID=2053013 RepID=A0ABX0ZKD9_9ACTN|nr:hypothetical protein [Actinacidiphila epipremni]NJP44245.1 hypothetical protein [Actinacidiphila epipremni]